MDKHLNQARYNRTFHDSVHDCFCDDYFDWKITALFYCALHYIRAFIKMKGQTPGTTHEQIDNQINPRKSSSKLKVSVTCWDNYRNLYLYSRSARYDGFLDMDAFKNDKKFDHNNSEQHLTDIIKYLKSNGLKIEEITPDNN